MEDHDKRIVFQTHITNYNHGLVQYLNPVPRKASQLPILLGAAIFTTLCAKNHDHKFVFQTHIRNYNRGLVQYLNSVPRELSKAYFTTELQTMIILYIEPV